MAQCNSGGDGAPLPAAKQSTVRGAVPGVEGCGDILGIVYASTGKAAASTPPDQLDNTDAKSGWGDFAAIAGRSCGPAADSGGTRRQPDPRLGVRTLECWPYWAAWTNWLV